MKARIGVRPMTLPTLVGGASRSGRVRDLDLPGALGWVCSRQYSLGDLVGIERRAGRDGAADGHGRDVDARRSVLASPAGARALARRPCRARGSSSSGNGSGMPAGEHDRASAGLTMRGARWATAVIAPTTLTAHASSCCCAVSSPIRSRWIERGVVDEHVGTPSAFDDSRRVRPEPTSSVTSAVSPSAPWRGGDVESTVARLRAITPTASPSRESAADERRRRCPGRHRSRSRSAHLGSRDLARRNPSNSSR